jgi:hypothetical protein
VYVQLSRMGSGDGWFARLRRPKVKRDTEGEMKIFYELKDRLPIYQTSLRSLEILGKILAPGTFVFRRTKHEFTTRYTRNIG